MKRYKLAIFDLDGTLLDTLQDLADSTNYALWVMGFPIRTIDEIRQFVGNGIRMLIARAVPQDATDEQIEKTLSIFKEYYANHCEVKTQPYPDIMQLLDKLIHENIEIAVVSNKIDSAVCVLCKKYFGDRVVIAVGEREGLQKKPSPDSIFKVLDILQTKKEDAIYIGDSEVDIETAKNAEIDCISVTWGFRDKEYLRSIWGFEKHQQFFACGQNSAIAYGKGLAYFADTPKVVETILLKDAESLFFGKNS